MTQTTPNVCRAENIHEYSHFTLSMHPRKEDEGVRLGLSSIFGSAKATQEADAVIILQNDGMVKYLDVRKNRYDGELGVVPLSVSNNGLANCNATTREKNAV